MYIQKQPLFHKAIGRSDLVITQSGIVTTDDTWRQHPLHSLDSRLYFVTAGSGMLISDAEQMNLEPGYVYLAPCGSKCGFYGTDSVSKLYFHINLQWDDHGFDVFSGLTHFAKLPVSIDKIHQYEAWYLSNDPFDHLCLKSALYQIICDLIQAEKDSMLPRNHHSQVVADAIGYISAHLSAKLTVKDVAEICLCSSTKLATAFHAEIGQSIASYIDDLLMSEAQNLLLYTDKSILRISEQLGFCDQFYFSRLFKKRFGLSPLHYRKRKNGA